MKNSTIIAGVGLSLVAGAVANKDAITLVTSGNGWIREAVATLVVPEIPDTVTGDIALWSAIMMDDYNGDFLQGVTSSSPPYVHLGITLLIINDQLTYLAVALLIVTMWTATGATSHTNSKVKVPGVSNLERRS